VGRKGARDYDASSRLWCCKDLSFHEKRETFTHLTNMAKASGEIVKHSASFANATSVAGPASLATGSLSALRHGRKIIKSADRIDGLLRLQKSRPPTREIEPEQMDDVQRQIALDNRLLKYAIAKNVGATTRNSLATVAAILGLAGTVNGWNPAGWALVGASAAIGLGLGASQLGGWLKNRGRAAYKLVKYTKFEFEKIQDDDWEDWDAKAASYDLTSLVPTGPEQKRSVRIFAAIGMTLNPKISRKQIVSELKKRKDQVEKLESNDVGGAREIMEREFWAHYLAGLVASEDGFADDMIYALFQEPRKEGGPVDAARKSTIKVIAKKFFVSQPPDSYYDLKQALVIGKSEETETTSKLRDILTEEIMRKLRSTS
jgi:hypothetical protein